MPTQLAFLIGCPIYIINEGKNARTKGETKEYQIEKNKFCEVSYDVI